MKNLLTAYLPALALLALSGCASTAGLASSEDDGVYYSSKDRTTAIVRAAPEQEPASNEEAANPDYNGSTARSSTRQNQNSGSDEYYDNTYTYMRGVPGPGVSYYTPYSPYTNLNYAGAWGGMGGFGMSPFGFYDPFFSPFASPFYGYGPGLSISMGFGNPWGFGGFGYGRRMGLGMGYGAGFYDPFFHGGPFYSGFYGRGAYYGNAFHGNNFGYGNRSFGNENVRPSRTYGPRNNRVMDGRYSAGGGTASPNGAVRNADATVAPGRARVQDRLAPGTPQTIDGATGTQTRSENISASPTENGRNEGYNRPRRQMRGEQPVYRDMTQPGERIVREGDATPQREQTTTPQEGQRRRGGFFQNVVTPPSNPAGQTADQPVRQRTYEQPRQERTRTYEQPRQQSYEPQRSSQPSYSAPSYNSGGGGGGGGGGSRGRSRD
ncbi:hypothetical protein [Hymenobacter arizonensis]|uniref:YXWGXW repeat-containing protein n=1 Tax=Hymenobacter arizonensis TaxID=1227077 RepID=A0A1I6B6Z5_HYMAR|nr:hypothetical protein [Hymenobacter arizonensis]SFQ76567.1 hypothetical protein SAMN04515668_4227 [Hymenobacter arizonensis]